MIWAAAENFRKAHKSSYYQQKKIGPDWQADHVVAVVEGGGLCGLENYRTLCTPCHKKATADLAARLAEAPC